MHLRAKGVDKVILTAPGKGDIPNIIYGVNSGDICPEERLLVGGELHHQRHRPRCSR